MTPEELNTIIPVLEAPVYQELSEALFEIFQLSRQTDRNPAQILDIQIGLSHYIRELEGKKSEFKRQGDHIRATIARRLALLAKQIADSIAWRLFEFDRTVVQRLSEHPQTGHLDQTVLADLDCARRIVENEDAIVLVNDLTTTLRYGDLTIFSGDQYSFKETKYGKASRRSKRSKRQRKQLAEIMSFLTTGIRFEGDSRTLIFNSNIQADTYHNKLDEIIRTAKNRGYAQDYLSECLAVQIIYTRHSGVAVPTWKPFSNTEFVWSISNLDNFTSPTPRVVPYANFPLSERDCFDLLIGNLIIIATLNFECLKGKYSEFGLNFNFPQPSDDELNAILTAPIATRKKLMAKHGFTVDDGKTLFTVLAEYFARITLEFLTENTLIEGDRELITLMGRENLQIPSRTILYTGYKHEKEIWR